MSNKWLWLVIGAVVLSMVCAAACSAETVYSDGWVPPRLVDGVWVSSGVSDEVAKEEAARLEQERADEQATWRQWYGNWAHQGPSINGWTFQGLQQCQAGAGMLNLPPGVTFDDYRRLLQATWQRENPLPECFEGGMGLATGGFVGRRVFPPTQHNGPFIDGLDLWTWRDRAENNYRWLTGQNRYTPWVRTK